MWTSMMTIAMLTGLLIFAAQLHLARRIARAKTDVPIFNQIFVLCLVFSGRLFFLQTRRNCVILAFFVPHALTPPGTATMISVPLNMWIMSLEDQDQEDQQLRQNLCSILAVVSFITIIATTVTIIIILIISTEGALRLPTTHENNPTQPHPVRHIALNELKRPKIDLSPFSMT